MTGNSGAGDGPQAGYKPGVPVGTTGHSCPVRLPQGPQENDSPNPSRPIILVTGRQRAAAAARWRFARAAHAPLPGARGGKRYAPRPPQCLPLRYSCCLEYESFSDLSARLVPCQFESCVKTSAVVPLRSERSTVQKVIN